MVVVCHTKCIQTYKVKWLLKQRSELQLGVAQILSQEGGVGTVLNHVLTNVILLDFSYLRTIQIFLS